jgi:hypothetical protein
MSARRLLSGKPDIGVEMAVGPLLTHCGSRTCAEQPLSCRKNFASQNNSALTRSAGGERVVVQAFRMAGRAHELPLVRRSKSLIRSPPPANSRWPTGGPPACGRLRSR